MTSGPLNRRKFLQSSIASLAAPAALAAAGILAPTADAQTFINEPDFGPMPLPAPEWLRHAVIAEVPTRGFNVSNFKDPSRWKDPFGDTTYRSIADKLDYLHDMGFNVLCLYSIYNCTPETNLFALRYNQQNPGMGTLADAKDLIDQAHKRGMYVISNTNHYGVDKTSPLLAEHPQWFLPATQLLYSQRVFDLTNAEARSYIVGTHVSWCVNEGLDGWRIDSAGHCFKRALWSEIVQQCADKGKRILIATENKPLVGYIQGSGRAGFPPILDMQANVGHSAKADDPYRIGEVSGHNVGEPQDPVKCCAFNSKQGSACGREGCFKVKGSQYIYGYNSLFAPAVPWMLVGETFDATDLALPKRTENPKMLHSWLDWTDAETQKQTVDDFKKLGQIRTANQDLFHNNIFETHLVNVPCKSEPASPVKPYARYLKEKKAAIVIGNNSTTDTVTFTLELPLEAMGMDKAKTITITDALTGRTKVLPPAVLNAYKVIVPADKSPTGGVRVLLLTPSA